MPHHDGRYSQVCAEAFALFEELRELLYRLSEEHPARPAVHTAAIAAFCHWRGILAPSIADTADHVPIATPNDA